MLACVRGQVSAGELRSVGSSMCGLWAWHAWPESGPHHLRNHLAAYRLRSKEAPLCAACCLFACVTDQAGPQCSALDPQCHACAYNGTSSGYDSYDSTCVCQHVCRCTHPMVLPHSTEYVGWGTYGWRSAAGKLGLSSQDDDVRICIAACGQCLAGLTSVG